MDKVAFHRLLWVCLFGIAFAFVESSVVVYLRALYYPEGLSFPVKMISQTHLAVELVREFATIIMLVAVGVIAGTNRWKRFGYFVIAFGIWDVFYYVWLKVVLNWPLALTDWDVLFLIPLPWVAPVVAPVLIALMMTVCGVVMVVRLEKALPFHPGLLSWLLGSAGTATALYSFLYDSPAILRGEPPSPYPYALLILSLVLYLTGFITSFHPRALHRYPESG
jgi:hypothetical protein